MQLIKVKKEKKIITDDEIESRNRVLNVIGGSLLIARTHASTALPRDYSSPAYITEITKSTISEIVCAYIAKKIDRLNGFDRFGYVHNLEQERIDEGSSISVD